MGYALTVQLELTTMTCGGGQMTFAIPAQLYRRYRQEQGLVVKCPNPACPWGGMQSGDCENAKLKRELESATAARRWAEQNLEQERSSHSATKGQLTKIKKRVQSGVCPCCNRSFQNVARHMKTKHPERSA